MTQAVRSREDSRARLNLRRTLCYIVLAVICFLCLFFFYVLVINATHSHFEVQKGFSFLPGTSFSTNLHNALTDANIPVVSGILNSLTVSAMSALLAVYFSGLTAYGIHAYSFRLKNLALTFILLIMSMPTQVSAVGFVSLVTGMGLDDSLIPLFLPKIAAPTVFYFIIQYMKGNLPMEIVEAARVDGSGEFFTFNRIVLPMLKPAISVQLIFTFVESWNNYFLPALLLDKAEMKTVPIMIAQLRAADYSKFDLGKVYMFILLAILPVLLVYIFLSRYIVKGVTAGSVKG